MYSLDLLFITILEVFNLVQHVNRPTHNKGHTLDAIITRSGDDLVDNVKVRDPMLSDHLAIHCNLKIVKPSYKRKEIIFRKILPENQSDLHKDIKEYVKSQVDISDLSSLVTNYEKELCRIIDIHAPAKRKTITVRPSAPWYNSKIDEEKRKRRKLERRWRKSRLEIDRQLYKDQCKLVNSLIKSEKENYYSTIISENKGNQKVLFKTVDTHFYIAKVNSDIQLLLLLNY